MTRAIVARIEDWPIAGEFRIARGGKRVARVLYVEIEDDGAVGRGESVPYPRFGETAEGSLAAVERLAGAIAQGLTRDELQRALPPGAARNAIDCALWDLEAKRAGRRAWQLAGLDAPTPVTTTYTLSVATPAATAEAARRHASRPVLKLKLDGSDDDLARIRAVRENAPASRLVVDANESWTVERYRELAPALAGAGVALIEQPLPAAADEALAALERPVPICADESCRDRASLASIAGRYDFVNVKLDKTGGLTEAIALVRDAEAAGLGLMIGCMVATSLAMAPAMLLASRAAFVDLDGPLLLERDRPERLAYEAGGLVHPPERSLWG